ncbi:rho guanine nucleotide exchange factor 18a isoform X3 [Alosa pseudoharengus]|uniref:rho guanine nucleotide exchange factor 18a isoform X3 n=1 Tax=Alosa pseudoharengus TaxID=34774 RepID=UPI003F88D345
MDEIDAIKLRLEESFISSQIEPINIEVDPHYTDLRASLEADVQGFEVETWGLSVDQQYMKQLQKEAIKRQEVIYELIQTEINYVRTLKIMLGVFSREMRSVLDEARLQRLLPPVDSLLEIHQHFLRCLKERRLQSQEPGSENNYCIQRLGDILCSQFSGEMGVLMKENYGGFCSHHNDAVGYYREQVQSNKKLQYMMRKISQLTIVRRLEVPACILLVTQRITKYPVLVERIIKNTEAGTEEHEELVRALGLIKGTIMQVDGLVNEYEKAQRLRDIAGRMDPKSLGRMGDGREFRREDLLRGDRKLLHEGTVNCRTSSGRLKDVLTVLLSDVLILLQEKDQKYVFFSVDNKSSVMPLQKLIVRNVALDEKAMFLICASSDLPEMCEVLTGSREERDTWMNHIGEAIASCPEDVDEELVSEQDEAIAARLRDFQEHLYMRDNQIVRLLEEKLQVFAALTETVAGVDDTTAYRRLLLRGTAPDLQQGEQLLLGAIADVEALQGLLMTGEQQNSAPHTQMSPERNSAPHTEMSPELAALPRRTQTFQGYDHLRRNGDPRAEGRERNQRPSSDPLVREHYPTEGTELSADEEVTAGVGRVDLAPFPKAEFSEMLMAISQKLYSLQAVITEHDTSSELLRATGSGDRASRQRGNMLLEQERQRNLERHREEQANFQRLQNQHRQEQERWERERRQQQLLAETADAELRQRREECERQEAQLTAERDELQRHRQDYQQDLERLREATRTVEKQREELEQQRKKLEKAKKSNTICSPGHFSYEAVQSFSHATTDDWPLMTSTGEDLFRKPHLRPSLSQATSSFLEKPPEVPPRRESISPSIISPSSTKTEVPMHLISTTNQAHKGGPIQQQIPTKLALIKGKEKGGKSKSHHRTNSAASIEVSQVIPIKVTGKEGGSLKSKRASSPRHLHPDTFVRPDKPSNSKPSHAASTRRKAGQSQSQDPQSRHKKGSGTPKEDIIFF